MQVIRQGEPHGVVFFGEPWDAPITDGGTQVVTPVGKACYDCRETIVEGDRGYIRPVMVSAEETRTGYVHRECDMLSIVGHMVGVCSCWPERTEGKTRREQAFECVRRWEARGWSTR